ncbi:MAG: DUF1016 N-terminal domain-containing protein [Solirubrobacteraceae bacterium]
MAHPRARIRTAEPSPSRAHGHSSRRQPFVQRAVGRMRSHAPSPGGRRSGCSGCGDRRQAQAGWGSKVVDRLTRDLRSLFPDMGMSSRNLKYMRAFAKAWPDLEIVQGCLAQMSWWHQIALLAKLDGPEMRLWYADTAGEHGWTRDVLVHQIEDALHLREGLLLEMGEGFAVVGRQRQAPGGHLGPCSSPRRFAASPAARPVLALPDRRVRCARQDGTRRPRAPAS